MNKSSLCGVIFCLALGGAGGVFAAGNIAGATQPSLHEASRFLSQSTFGPDRASIYAVVSTGMDDWFLDQLAIPATLHLDDVLAHFPGDRQFLEANGRPVPEVLFAASDSFWHKAIEAPDQLRQRMAFALSQVLVISADSQLAQAPQAVAAYMDVLTRGSFGNFRDLLEEVTYSPAMAVYLTYIRNQKADTETGRVPDENYARELLQLFTLGLVELNADGTVVVDDEGASVELFNNDDITGLASVFTGLTFRGAGFQRPFGRLPFKAYYSPLRMVDRFHTSDEKTFLGTTIAANTPGNESIALALDAIFNHPNVGPFLSRQLIQRFVTSHPTPDYVFRVAEAFDQGSYKLPSGSLVGNGARGDLSATLAAILFDEQARSADYADETGFGKLREPVLRFTHWARAFEVNSADASNQLALRNTADSQLLGQHPYRSPSVFNFYRPGYIAPGTETGAAGLTAPELQIVNAATIVGYPNFMTLFALGEPPLDDDSQPRTYVADYEVEAALAGNPAALLNYLDLLLTHGSLLPETRKNITAAIEPIGVTTLAERKARARIASVLVMTSPEYIVLR